MAVSADAGSSQPFIRRKVNLPAQQTELSMEGTIVAYFETRRDAELAVEHLVQEHGVARTDIFIRANHWQRSSALTPHRRWPGPTSSSAPEAKRIRPESGRPVRTWKVAMTTRSAAPRNWPVKSRYRSIITVANPSWFARH